MMPPLAAAYTVSPMLPTRPASLEILTILPCCAAIIGGNTARLRRTAPSRLIAMSRSHMSGGFSIKGSMRSQPAPLTRPSMSSTRVCTAAAKSVMLSGCVKSSGRNSTARPSLAACAAVVRPPASSISPIKTRAPSRASSSAVARPIPDAPPVTMTVRSCISIALRPPLPGSRDVRQSRCRCQSRRSTSYNCRGRRCGWASARIDKDAGRLT